MYNIYDYFSESIVSMSSKEDFESFLNSNGDYIFRSYEPAESYFACLINEVLKHNNFDLYKNVLDWAIDRELNNELVLHFIAESIRVACNHNSVEFIEVIRKCNFSYEKIREQCFYTSSGWDYEYYHSSPLCFAVEADSYKCFHYLLKWMQEERADINKEGYKDDVSLSGNRISIIELLCKNGKADWIDHVHEDGDNT